MGILPLSSPWNSSNLFIWETPRPPSSIGPSPQTYSKLLTWKAGVWPSCVQSVNIDKNNVSYLHPDQQWVLAARVVIPLILSKWVENVAYWNTFLLSCPQPISGLFAIPTSSVLIRNRLSSLHEDFLFQKQLLKSDMSKASISPWNFTISDHRIGLSASNTFVSAHLLPM